MQWQHWLPMVICSSVQTRESPPPSRGGRLAALSRGGHCAPRWAVFSLRLEAQAPNHPMAAWQDNVLPYTAASVAPTNLDHTCMQPCCSASKPRILVPSTAEEQQQSGTLQHHGVATESAPATQVRRYRVSKGVCMHRSVAQLHLWWPATLNPMRALLPSRPCPPLRALVRSYLVC